MHFPPPCRRRRFAGDVSTVVPRSVRRRRRCRRRVSVWVVYSLIFLAPPGHSFFGLYNLIEYDIANHLIKWSAEEDRFVVWHGTLGAVQLSRD